MWPFKRKNAIGSNTVIDVNKPVTNPDLKGAFQNFAQYKTEQNFAKALSELKRANFLVLINQDEMVISKTPEDGITTMMEGSVIKFLQTSDEKGNPFMPIFTDWKEIDQWLTDRKDIASLIMPSDQAFKFVLNDSTVLGLVINPCSDRWNMSKEQINNFLNEV